MTEERESSMSSVIARVVENYQATAAQRGIDLRLGSLDALPRRIVPETSLGRALGNLLSNAIKFTPDGGLILVSVEVTDDALVLRVADNGPGVSDKDRERIFLPGCRAAPSTHGMGIGLAVTRSLVRSIGGSVSCERRTTGATFRLSLPISEC